MSLQLLSIHGRVDDAQLSAASKAAARRVALCVSTFPPNFDDDATPCSFNLARVIDFTQLATALPATDRAAPGAGTRKGGGGAGEEDLDDGSGGLSADTSAAMQHAQEQQQLASDAEQLHVVVIVTAKLRFTKAQGAECGFLMENSRKVLPLLELGRMVGETYAACASVTLLFNAMDDLTESRAEQAAAEFARGVVERTTPLPPRLAMRSFVSMSEAASTGSALEQLLADGGGSAASPAAAFTHAAAWRVCLHPALGNPPLQPSTPLWPTEPDRNTLLLPDKEAAAGADGSARGDSSGERRASPSPRPEPPSAAHEAAPVSCPTVGHCLTAAAQATGGAHDAAAGAVLSSGAVAHAPPASLSESLPTTPGPRVECLRSAVVGGRRPLLLPPRPSSPTEKVVGSGDGANNTPATVQVLQFQTDRFRDIFSDPKAVFQPGGGGGGLLDDKLSYFCRKCNKSYTDEVQHALLCDPPTVAVHAVPDAAIPTTQEFEECRALIRAGIIVVRDEVLSGAPVLLKPPPASLLPMERWCDLCGMLVNGDKNWQQHISGEKHRRLVDKSNGPNAQRAYHCTSCETKLYGDANLMQHISGMKHLKAAELRTHFCSTCKMAFAGDRRFVEHLDSMAHSLQTQAMPTPSDMY